MTYSNHLVNLVLHNIKDGKSIVQVSQIYNVAKQTIYRWIKMYMDQVIMNQMVTRQTCRSNRKLDKYASAVVDYVTNNLGCSIYDIYLNAVNKEISLSTISRIAKANGISHKKINNKTVCKDITKIEDERKQFVKEKTHETNEAIFIDETSFCISDHKSYGFGLTG
jgi:transposase